MAQYSRNIPVPHRSSSEIYEKISSAIHHFEEGYEGQFGKFKVDCDPIQKTITLESKMATAKLVCHESEIDLQGKLSLLALPFRSKIDGWIDRWIEKTFQT